MHRYECDKSKTTTSVVREVVEVYITDSVKLPWHVDLLNITMEVRDL